MGPCEGRVLLYSKKSLKRFKRVIFRFLPGQYARLKNIYIYKFVAAMTIIQKVNFMNTVLNYLAFFLS